MSAHRFTQVDVFTDTPLRGNPLAVVHDAGDLGDAQMKAFARWTNLSETTFLLPPTDPRADYRVRIFTPTQEFPFAGHPTLGSRLPRRRCAAVAMSMPRRSQASRAACASRRTRSTRRSGSTTAPASSR
jgi:PhzF family phenazine biosynthesis protein